MPVPTHEAERRKALESGNPFERLEALLMQTNVKNSTLREAAWKAVQEWAVVLDTARTVVQDGEALTWASPALRKLKELVK